MARPRNVLQGKTATVAYTLGGLTITAADIPAVDAVVAAAAMLKAARSLPRQFPELIEGVSVHGGAIDQPEEIDGEDFVLPPSMGRQVGFHRR